jgi:hypothetical protein
VALSSTYRRRAKGLECDTLFSEEWEKVSVAVSRSGMTRQ